MDPGDSIYGLVALFLLIAINVPVSIALFLVGFFGIYFILSPMAAYNLISAGIWEQISSYPLSVIPLFIFMGEILSRSGVTQQMMNSAYAWIGHMRGSMASTTILTGVGFGAVCGSNSATTAAVGNIALPEMEKYGYHPRLRSGVVAAAGTLGTIVPPSSVLIIVALQAELAIRDLFLASIVPAFILVSFLIATVYMVCLLSPLMGPAGERTTFFNKVKTLPGVFEVLALFTLVLGGLFAGWFTSTEAAAVGCLGAIVIALTKKRLDLKSLKDSISSTLIYSSMILMLITGAVIFGRFLAITGLPFYISDWAADLALPALLVMAIVLLVFLVGGAIMDAMGFLVIAMPIFLPVSLALGYDPVWFGVMVCLATGMGAITPPIAVNAFIVNALDETIGFKTIISGIVIFIPSFVFTMVAMLIFPGLITLIL